MTSRATVHPFPARMAPELVQERLDDFFGRKIVLDPMMGSGSFVIAAARRGHDAIGIDTDPLAHIITRAATGLYDKDLVAGEARRIVSDIKRGLKSSICFDSETGDFVNFWFDEATIDKLGALVAGIESSPSSTHAPLWCALSRMIITKDAGVSRARDVSHSRPHRSRELASFDPVERFETSVKTVLSRASGEAILGSVSTIRADVRSLPLPSGSVHGIMTSPPYLIAIDYLRGHRLSLVWMGYSISQLRSLRGDNIGSERGSEADLALTDVIRDSVSGQLPDRKSKILNRYVRDLDATVSELSRVLRRRGSVTFVVANSKHSNASISVEQILMKLAGRHFLHLDSRSERQLPTTRRYLPPPRTELKALAQRMHTEVILKFSKK